MNKAKEMRQISLEKSGIKKEIEEVLEQIREQAEKGKFRLEINSSISMGACRELEKEAFDVEINQFQKIVIIKW